MQDHSYRNSLKETVTLLDSIQEELYIALSNVVLNGEFREWADQIEEGEAVELPSDIFSKCEDQNVIRLNKLRDVVRDTTESIKNINTLTYD